MSRGATRLDGNPAVSVLACFEPEASPLGHTSPAPFHGGKPVRPAPSVSRADVLCPERLRKAAFPRLPAPFVLARQDCLSYRAD